MFRLRRQLALLSMWCHLHEPEVRKLHAVLQHSNVQAAAATGILQHSNVSSCGRQFCSKMLQRGPAQQATFDVVSIR
jgi:hypothetical protein